jgi:hypothetical protein
VVGGLGADLVVPPVTGVELNHAPLADTEVIPVEIDGTPSAPFQALQWNGTDDHTVNELNTPRHGHAMVRSGNWLYVLGGAVVDTAVYEPDPDLPSNPVNVDALATVERARILGLETRPEVTHQSVDTNPVAGAPVKGIWYYQVSALGDWGESLPSEVVMIYNPADSNVPRLAWDAVPGATGGYNVYRSATPNGDGSTYWLDTVVAGTTTYQDNTGVLISAVAPLRPGSIGKWQSVFREMSTGREGLGAVTVSIAGDGGKSSFIYAVGGREDNQLVDGDGLVKDYLADGEFAAILSDGDLSSFSPMDYEMTHGRAFFKLLTSFGQDVVIAPPSDPGGEGPLGQGAPIEDLVLIAVAGDTRWDTKGSPPTADTNNPDLKLTDICLIEKENGYTGEWFEQDQSWAQAYHGMGALLYFDTLWIWEGVQSEILGNDPSGGSSAAKGVSYIGPVIATDVYNIVDTQDTALGASNATNTSYYQVLRLNGYLFSVGGNNESGPGARIDRTRW